MKGAALFLLMVLASAGFAGCGGGEGGRGDAWTSSGNTKNLYALGVTSLEPRRIYAAGYPSGLSSSVYVSEGDFNKWDTLGKFPEATTVIALSMSRESAFYILAMSEKALFKLDQVTDNWSVIGPDGVVPTTVASFFQDGHIVIFLGTRDKGMYIQPIGTPKIWRRGGPEAVNVTGFAIFHQNVDMVLVATHGNGVFKTIDGTATWYTSSVGFETPYVTCLSICETSGKVVYAGTDGGGIYRSVDRGDTWRPVTQQMKKVDTILCSTEDEKTCYAGGADGVLMTSNKGATWGFRNEGLQGKRVRGLVEDPKDRSMLFAATDGGIFKLKK